MTWELLQFFRRENIVLVPRHIPGKHNILADALSRLNKLVSTEWTLHMDIVQGVRDLWASPTIDLFATKMNNRLPQYMSLLPDPKALAENALAVSWDGMNAYAFPPTPLIQAVLNKVMTDKVKFIPFIRPPQLSLAERFTRWLRGANGLILWAFHSSVGWDGLLHHRFRKISIFIDLLVLLVAAS
jgi:hypothetical protein